MWNEAIVIMSYGWQAEAIGPQGKHCFGMIVATKVILLSAFSRCTSNDILFFTCPHPSAAIAESRTNCVGLSTFFSTRSKCLCSTWRFFHACSIFYRCFEGVSHVSGVCVCDIKCIATEFSMTWFGEFQPQHISQTPKNDDNNNSHFNEFVSTYQARTI